jgi:hypothetical protein
MYNIDFTNGADFLTLRIHGRVRPDAQDYWDANWLHCAAEASAGGLRAKLDWQLRNEDLLRFLRALESLETRVGEAVLDTGDGWLDIRVVRDDKGNIEARCQLEDGSLGESVSEFRLSLNQTVLAGLKAQLRQVVEQYPVVGREAI